MMKGRWVRMQSSPFELLLQLALMKTTTMTQELKKQMTRLLQQGLHHSGFHLTRHQY